MMGLLMCILCYMRGRRRACYLCPHTRPYPPPKPKQLVHLISRKGCERLVRSGVPVFILFIKELSKGENPMHPSMVKLLAEFQDVFPKKLPIGLPTIRGIKH